MKNHILRSASAATLILSISAGFATTASAQDSYSDEIIVTGSPLIRSVDEAITGVSVLTGEELSQRLAGTIGETLKSEPGVSSTFFGAGASRPIIRGQGGDRVRVLTNGIGSIDASSASPDHAVAAEPAQAERIEVLRGASLLRYGSSGSGGIINIIDGRIPSDVPEDGIDGAFRIGASSVDNGREAAGSIDFGAGNVVFHFDGTIKETDNYKIPGFAESARLRALEEDEDHHDDDHDEEHDDDHDDEDEDDDHDEEEHNEEEEEEGEEQVTIGLDQIRLDINGALELDGFFEKVQIFGGYADYEHTEFEAPGEVGTVFTNEGYEAKLELIQRENDGWAAAYGVQLRNRDFSA